MAARQGALTRELWVPSSPSDSCVSVAVRSSRGIGIGGFRVKPFSPTPVSPMLGFLYQSAELDHPRWAAMGGSLLLAQGELAVRAGVCAQPLCASSVELRAHAVAALAELEARLPSGAQIDVPAAGVPLVAISLGLAGARLLLATTDARFVRVVPWMLLGATTLFTVGPKLTKRLGAGSRTTGRILAALVFQGLVAGYGGFFGGGMGILMLAAFSLLGVESIHEANALKSLLGVLINGAAALAFFAAGRGDLRSTWPIVVTAVLGGYGGAAVARRVDAARVRPVVAMLAWCTTVAVCVRFWS
jgi:uncharacterized membrane protein YfcA